MDEQTPNTYTLIATIGLSPAVVTEVIWKLATDPENPRIPEELIVLTTGPGYVSWMNKLIDSGVWGKFCNEILDGATLTPQIKLPTREDNIPLLDLNNAEDDLLIANLSYSVVYEHTRPGARQLVGSLAGGRKTMSAHMMSAFTAYARPFDELMHVLVPPEIEADKSFFYPAPGKPAPPIHCVNIPFAPLYGYLKRGIFGKVEGDERDLNALIEAVKNYNFDEPKKVACYVGDGKWLASSVVFMDDNGPLPQQLQFSTQNLATFLVIAQQIAQSTDGVSNQQLIEDLAQQQYRTVVALFGKSHTRWEVVDDVTSAISRLNIHLKKSKIAEKHLAIEGQRYPETTIYQWRHTPPLSVELLGTKEMIKRAAENKWDHYFPDFPIRLSVSPNM